MLDIPSHPSDAQERHTAEFLRVKGLAERGVAQAQHTLGFMYVNGQGVARNYELAVAWYRMAASSGLEQASTTSA